MEKTAQKTMEKTRKKTRKKSREKIIRIIQEDKEVTMATLADRIGLSEKGIEYHLQKLKTEKVIERVGADRGGY